MTLKPKVMQKLFDGNYDRKLFAKLHRLRKSVTGENNTLPYMVSSDTTLTETVEQTPITTSEMLNVGGVSMRKLERFDKPLTALIRAHVDGNDEE